jgi:peptidoglycan/LPS O-acetylase OafA/YrhL
LRERFEVLDAFRGLFALFVALYHMGSYSILTENELVNSSYLFVDYFFVLSGFVIMHAYSGRITNLLQFKNFVGKRLLRLYPLHLLMLVLFIVLEIGKSWLYYIGILNFPSFTSNTIEKLVSAILLLNSTGIGIVGSIGWNFPSWSISAEFLAYILFALIMLLIMIKQWSYLVLFIIPIISLLILYLISDSFSIIYQGDYGFIRGIFGFFVGSCVYVIRANWLIKKKFYSFILFSLIELLIIGLILILIAESKSIINLSFVYPLIFGISIIIFSYQKGITSKFMKHPFFQALGRYSVLAP